MKLFLYFLVQTKLNCFCFFVSFFLGGGVYYWTAPEYLCMTNGSKSSFFFFILHTDWMPLTNRQVGGASVLKVIQLGTSIVTGVIQISECFS